MNWNVINHGISDDVILQVSDRSPVRWKAVRIGSLVVMNSRATYDANTAVISRIRVTCVTRALHGPITGHCMSADTRTKTTTTNASQPPRTNAV